MEEAIESTILLVVLLSFAVIALAYAAPQAQYQIRAGEIRSAIAAMKVAAEREARVVTGDSSGSFDFNFPYGTFSVATTGNTTILVTGDSGTSVLYNDYHRVLDYKTNMGGYPATFVADRGALPQSYYQSVDDASLAYHYTSQVDGYTHVVADSKIAFYTTNSTDGSTTVLHILVVQLMNSTIVAQRGPIGLLFVNQAYVTANPQGPVTITLTSGLKDNGQPLTTDPPITISTPNVSILMQIVYVRIQD